MQIDSGADVPKNILVTSFDVISNELTGTHISRRRKAKPLLKERISARTLSFTADIWGSPAGVYCVLTAAKYAAGIKITRTLFWV